MVSNGLTGVTYHERIVKNAKSTLKNNQSLICYNLNAKCINNSTAQQQRTTKDLDQSMLAIASRKGKKKGNTVRRVTKEVATKKHEKMHLPPTPPPHNTLPQRTHKTIYSNRITPRRKRKEIITKKKKKNIYIYIYTYPNRLNLTTVTEDQSEQRY